MNNRGYSLVELMVTVAIIAILASLAVPSYQRVQSRARQKEAITLGGAYYAAAQATYTEFGIYPGNFVATGFRPEGELRYRLRSVNNTGTNMPIAGIPNDNLCTGTNNAIACDCGGTCTFKEWIEVTGVAGTSIGAGNCNWGTVTCGAPTTTDTSFRILLCGVVNTKTGLTDQYRMDHNKRFIQCIDGL